MDHQSSPMMYQAIIHSFTAGAVAAHPDLPCTVRFKPGGISVMFQEDGEEAVYEGIERGPGHYELVCRAFDGRATLHRFDKAGLLDGYIVQEGWTGMWRIKLGELLTKQNTSDAD